MLWLRLALRRLLSSISAVYQVEDLARLSFKRQPLYVGIDDSKAVSTREGLEQGYCVVPSVQRFLLLFTFLKKNLQKKVRAAWVSSSAVAGRHQMQLDQQPVMLSWHRIRTIFQLRR